MATAMAGPVAAEQNSEAWARKAQPGLVGDGVEDGADEQGRKQTKGHGSMASTKYRFKLISICFRARNDRKRLD